MRNPRLLASALALGALCFARGAAAQWPSDPHAGGLDVGLGGPLENESTAVADGADGQIVLWVDGGRDACVFAQRLDPLGSPLWSAGGVRIFGLAGSSAFAGNAVADGSGGACVARTFTSGWFQAIRAQRVDRLGQVLWGPDGVAIPVKEHIWIGPAVAPDGSGGMFVAWIEVGTYPSNKTDVYAQRIDSSGALRWSASGLWLYTDSGPQWSLQLIPDGAGGALLSWIDGSDSEGGSSVLMLHLSAQGNRLWGSSPKPVSVSRTNQLYASLTSDGARGAIIAWEAWLGDRYGLLAQRVGFGGALLWGDSARTVATSPYDLGAPRAIPDRSGGVIIAWSSFRNGARRCVAQRMTGDGVPLWHPGGTLVSSSTAPQYLMALSPDGADGAIAVLGDTRTDGHGNVFAQRVDASGRTLWDPEGVPVALVEGQEYRLVSLPDDAEGALLSWTQQDWDRNSYAARAQHLDAHGALGDARPQILAIADDPGDEGGWVRVAWSASHLDTGPRRDVGEYRIWRLGPGALKGAAENWELIATQPALGVPRYELRVPTVSDSAPTDPAATAFRVEARSLTVVDGGWTSTTRVGHSVDNLAPQAPANFAARIQGGATVLAWDRATAPDFALYRLYRGGEPGLVPNPGYLLAVLTTQGYVDAVAEPAVYQLTAVDRHGNESLAAVTVPVEVEEPPPALPARLALTGAVPNPLPGDGTIRFELPIPGAISLTVHDIRGAEVAVLASGPWAGGFHALRWDGRGSDGARLPAGIYFARLATGGVMRTRRLVLLP